MTATDKSISPSAAQQAEIPPTSTMDLSISVPSLFGDPHTQSTENGTSTNPISIPITTVPATQTPQDSPTKQEASETTCHQLTNTLKPPLHDMATQEPTPGIQRTLNDMESAIVRLSAQVQSTATLASALQACLFSIPPQDTSKPKIPTDQEKTSDVLPHSIEDRISNLEEFKIKAETRIAELEPKEPSKSVIANLLARIEQLEAAQSAKPAVEEASCTQPDESVLGSKGKQKAKEEIPDEEIPNSKTTTPIQQDQDVQPACTCKPSNQSTLTEPESHSTDINTALQTHLKPLIDGIAAIATQIANIDTRLSHLSPSQNSDTTTTFKSSSGSQTPTPKPPISTPSPKILTPSPPTPSSVNKTLPLPNQPHITHLKFGEPSTPTSRPLSRLNFAASPFGKYSEQTSSPFAVLAETAKQSGTVSKTGCFNCRDGCEKCRPGEFGGKVGEEGGSRGREEGSSDKAQ